VHFCGKRQRPTGAPGGTFLQTVLTDSMILASWLRLLSGLDEICYTTSEVGEMSENASTGVWDASHSRKIHWIGNRLRGLFFGV